MPTPHRRPLRAEIRPHNGRATVFVNDVPQALPAYSPVAFRRAELAKAQTARFFRHGMGAYFVTVPNTKNTEDGTFFDTPFWLGDVVSDAPLVEPNGSLDEQVEHILQGDPQAFIIVRFGAHEPKSWRELHPDELFVTETGVRLPVPSLASENYWQSAAQYGAAIIAHCEAKPWAHRIIGYANFARMEGTHEPILQGWLFDHSAPMQQRWQQFHQEKYGAAAPPLPFDQLRGAAPDVAALLYWQNADDNRALRDYLLLTRDLYHAGFANCAAAMREELARQNRQRILVYDALKQPMMGWNNTGFFDASLSWSPFFAEDRAASGHIGVAPLFEVPGFDGLITPHDYQARGAGGVYEPEGAADSMALRGKFFFCEMDTRTFAGRDVNFPARDAREFEAVTWRNLATAWTRGFNSYWMDVYEDWFAAELHPFIARQVAAQKRSLEWPHEDVPGIAVILDDEAILETNGNGAVLNEHILWELKTGLPRCGVPFRVYLLDDLKLPNFPRHRVFYFPNLYRADAARLQLLRDTVLRDGHVVVWGPGSGISDGQQVGVEAAQELTGFGFDLLPVNHQRRMQISDFSHPITQKMRGDILGGPLAYGPVLFPVGGHELGRALTKSGRDLAGLSVKAMGNWHSVFTTTAPLPAEFWRGCARFAGAHIYCESDDILLADSSIVALHSLQTGRKRIKLPGCFSVYDVATGKLVGHDLQTISFHLRAPQTRVFRLQSAS